MFTSGLTMLHLLCESKIKKYIIYFTDIALNVIYFYLVVIWCFLF